MTITYVSGNLLDGSASCLLNTVNCEGVMGKGLALSFKERYPSIMPSYVKACRTGTLRPGMILPWHASDGRLVLSCATKESWRQPSRYEWVEAILTRIAGNYERLGITSLAVPPLGCGNGGLEWSVVRDMIEQHLGSLPIEVLVYGSPPATAPLSSASAAPEEKEWIAVVGSRDYPDLGQVTAFIATLDPAHSGIVSGGARGVDRAAEQAARAAGIEVQVFAADWNRYGKSAGFKRNVQIIEAASRVVAFWNGTSKGTAHDIELAHERGIPVAIVRP